jgi:microsomal dipeptidase-like Zn-dependent dipeptidase
MEADDLLRGAIDLHVHGYPELAFDAPSRLDDLEIANMAQQAGMKGFVLKSHLWPTVGRAYHLKKQFHGIEIFPSITLNTIAGGFSAIAVESAAKQGARVVFMPTWSSANDLQREGFSSYLKKYLETAVPLKKEDGLTLLESRGRLKNEVQEIIEVAKRYQLVISTGHISPQESLVLAKESSQAGFWPVIFAHPDSHSVGGTAEDIKAMASHGAFIEICAIGMMPAMQRIHPREFVKIIKEIGSEHFVLSTDFFFGWPPPAPEMLRMMIATFLGMGLSAEEIRLLVQMNPGRILRI